MTATSKGPESTRAKILRAAFTEFYKNGFQGGSLNLILDDAGTTKGALYHHFDSKEALGYAVVEEAIAEITRVKWLQPLQVAANPLEALADIIRSTSIRQEHVRGGCPLNNLAQEMSPLDEGFRKRIAKVFSDWQGAVVNALRWGQEHGHIRGDVDADESASFLLAAYEGYISFAKNSQDPQVLQSGKKNMLCYLDTLRTRAGR